MLAGRKGDWVPARGAAGLPDIFALHDDPRRMLILELKGSGGKLTDAQREFLRLARDLAEVSEHFESLERTIGVYVVEPHSLDAIEQVIRTRVLT